MSEPVYVCDKLTMKVVCVYDSLTKCAEGEGIPVSKVSDIARYNRVTKGKYVFRFESKYDPNESFKNKYHRPIKVINVVTGKVMYFHDVDEICEILGAKRSSITKNNIRYGCLFRKCLKITWAR